MKPDPRHEGMPRASTETRDEVWRDVVRMLRRQRDGEPADTVEARELLRRMREAR